MSARVRRPTTGASNRSSLASAGEAAARKPPRSRIPAGETGPGRRSVDRGSAILLPAGFEGGMAPERRASEDSTAWHERKKYKHFIQGMTHKNSGMLTRSQLLAARKNERLHFFDRYDLNGDGQVDPYEIMLGSLVDTDKDGKISKEEREKLREMIRHGDLKGISLGPDHSGGEAARCLTWWNSREARKEKEKYQEMKHSSTLKSKAHSETHTHTDSILDDLAHYIDIRDPDSAFIISTGTDDRGDGRKTPSLEYVEKPRYKSREALLQARRREMGAPKDYDLDGDGEVEPWEYFLARRLDVNNDGILGDEEKAKALDLLKEMKEGGYVFGLEGAGPNREVRGVDKQLESNEDTLDKYLGGLAEQQAAKRAKAAAERPGTGMSKGSRMDTGRSGLSRGPRSVASHRSFGSYRSGGSLASSRSRVSVADDIRQMRTVKSQGSFLPPRPEPALARSYSGSISRPRTGMSSIIGV